MLIKQLKKSHNFFINESPKYVGKYVKKYNLYNGEVDYIQTLSYKQKLYYPIAYIKFIYFSIKDYFHLIKSKQNDKQR